MADTMLYFSDNRLATNFLSMDDLQTKCPLAFKTEPTNPRVSDRYVTATTVDVINDLAKLGWLPVEAKQNRPKKNSSGIRSFHMIAFQNPNIYIPNNDGGVEAYPRIILTNSHDGFNSFKFMMGMFRLVCSNGLIVCDNEMANITIRHINYSFEELRKTVVATAENIGAQTKIIDTMRSISLTEDEKADFAVKAMKIRRNVPEDQKLSISEESIREILEPNRNEDKANDLWTVFNLIQEKMIRGDFYYSASSTRKSRKVRSITSASRNLDINTKLFELANSYIAA